MGLTSSPVVLRGKAEGTIGAGARIGPVDERVGGREAGAVESGAGVTAGAVWR